MMRIVLGAASIGFMAYINLKLTLLVLIPMPLLVIGTRFFSRKMHRRYQEVQGAFADLTEAVRERFAGIRVIKSYAWEDHEAARISDISRSYIKENIDLVKITGAFFPMMGFLTNLSLAIVIFVGGRQTITRTITPGDFVAFISYLGLLTWPMMALGWVTNLIQRGKASLDRLTRIMTTRPEIVDHPGAKTIGRSRGALAFENVRFAYTAGKNGNSQPVLTGIDLDIPPGSILGIVGPPGSGKTTLLNLIPRLYDVSGGRILLDGEDIRSLKLRDLRAQLSFVPQEPFLFAGSIRQNITLGYPDLDDRALTSAADQAAVHGHDHRLSQRLRHDRRGKGHHSLRRSEATYRPGARPASCRPDPCPRRSDQSGRPGYRQSDGGHFPRHGRRTNHSDRFAPSFRHPVRRHHHCAG